MPEVNFPSYVENFIEMTGDFLQDFSLTLVQTLESSASQSRTYELQLEDGPVEVIVHRTADSMNMANGEYRVRVIAPVIPEFTDYARKSESLFNRVATFGTLVDEARAVSCQCLVPQHNARTIAGLLGVAIARARTSLIVSSAKALAQDRSPSIEQLSAWSDLDFELADYDYAHLGRGRRYQRGWRMLFFGGATLTLDAVHNNPYWGGGLLSLLHVPRETLILEDRAIEAAELNMWGNLVGRTPTFGAWCRDDENFVFAQFLPNFVKPLPDLTDLIIKWASDRHHEARMFASLKRQSQNEV